MEEKEACKNKHSTFFSIMEKVVLASIMFVLRASIFVSSLSSSPLFSFIVVLQVLVLLYLPHLFLHLVFSPVLISTAIILSTLLRLGSTQLEKIEKFDSCIEDLGSVVECSRWAETQTNTEPCFGQNPFLTGTFVEWSRKSTLEVIYEEYEGEEEEEEEGKGEERDCSVQAERRLMGMEEFVNWSLCLPESDSESSSEADFPAWDSPESLCFRWEEEKEGMIEIPLEGKGFSAAEEENLIEIDLCLAGT